MRKIEFNVATGKIIEKNMTDEEIAQVEKQKLVFDLEQKEILIKEKARLSAQAKLIDLGLTEEEIAAL
jgi:hypothetical protein